jgi:hypothetical protein
MSEDLHAPAPDPASKYETPKQLAQDQSLSLAERRELLDQWEDDIRIRVVASEEGMTGPSAKIGLADILAAKALLPIDTPARDTAGKA